MSSYKKVLEFNRNFDMNSNLFKKLIIIELIKLGWYSEQLHKKLVKCLKNVKANFIKLVENYEKLFTSF